MRYLFPFINIAIAAVLFFMVTDGMFMSAPIRENRDSMALSTGGIRALRAREAELSQAVQKAVQLSEKVNQLNQQYNHFSTADIAKLDMVLPGQVDNIQLIIDVNGIAKKNSMGIKNIKLGTDSEEEKKPGSLASARSGGATSSPALLSKLGTTELSFSVTGTYDQYKAFLADLARSLRIIDISSSSFNTEDKGIYTYAVSLKTYWLKQQI